MKIESREHVSAIIEYVSSLCNEANFKYKVVGDKNWITSKSIEIDVPPIIPHTEKNENVERFLETLLQYCSDENVDYEVVSNSNKSKIFATKIVIFNLGKGLAFDETEERNVLYLEKSGLKYCFYNENDVIHHYDIRNPDVELQDDNFPYQIINVNNQKLIKYEVHKKLSEIIEQEHKLLTNEKVLAKKSLWKKIVDFFKGAKKIELEEKNFREIEESNNRKTLGVTENVLYLAGLTTQSGKWIGGNDE